ncbi:hypothetical protein CLCR_04577 [Cladophialophora carrionii]|uniref:C2H2-type domain-containing protein n=1 Tax=Cladophialophora carrionii TaxID=86049 RepID=A0A1C1CLS3_9EURO|nr:hypothetical protein CLCR_04577 [Cladophialophora carrionii]
MSLAIPAEAITDPVRTLSCPHCNATFKRKEHLGRHIQRHLGTRPFGNFVCTFRPPTSPQAVSETPSTQNPESNIPLGPNSLLSPRTVGAHLGDQLIPEAAVASVPHPFQSSLNAEQQNNPADIDLDGHHFPISDAPNDVETFEHATSAFDTEETLLQDLPWLTTIISSFNTPLWMNDFGDISFENSDSLGETSTFRAAAPDATTAALGGSRHEQAEFDRPRRSTGYSGAESPRPEASTPQARRAPLPPLSTEDRSVIHTEVYGYLQQPPAQAFAKIVEFFDQQLTLCGSFVDILTFQAFLELYFEFFADQFPFIHVSMMQRDTTSWILYLGVAAIGAQLSGVEHALVYAAALEELFREAVTINIPEAPPGHDLTWAQIILLHDIGVLFNSGKKRQLLLLYEKNRLITLCRGLRIKAVNELYQPNPAFGTGSRGPSWESWIAAESRTRLLYNVYFYECLQCVFHDIRPSVDLGTLTDNLPCADVLWKCQNEDEWRRLHYASKHEPLRVSQGSVANWKEQDWHWSSVVEQVLLSSMTSPTFASQTPPFGPRYIDYNAFLASVRKFVDNELELLYPHDDQGSSQPSATERLNVLCPLLLILRQVPVRRIYSFSGWQVDDSQMEASRRELSSWMSLHPKTTRICLFHAITIFVTLRKRSHISAYDGFALLISSLFIWAYDQIMNGGNPGTGYPDRTPTVRLERKIDVPAFGAWVREGFLARIHVTGVGILDGKDSSIRMLQELRRILASRIGWPTLCRVIDFAVAHLIQGQHPRFEDDQGDICSWPATV